MAQFNTGNNSFQAQNKTLFEVNQIATSNGSLVTTGNRLPVDIGNTSISISGNVNINTPNTVTVSSTPQDPVHTHITEVGTSGILTFPYMPISGNVVVTSINTEEAGDKYSFNNHATNTNRGWTMDETCLLYTSPSPRD